MSRRSSVDYSTFLNVFFREISSGNLSETPQGIPNGVQSVGIRSRKVLTIQKDLLDEFPGEAPGDFQKQILKNSFRQSWKKLNL